MPKNPFYADKVILKNGGVIETEDGTDIVAVNADGSTVTITGTETVIASEVALAEGNFLVGNASGVATALDIGNTSAGIAIGNGTTATIAALSGDATMSTSGVVTIANDAVNEAKVVDSAGVGGLFVAKTAVAVYDFDVDGGTEGVITLASTATIPDNAVVTGIMYEVLTTFTSGGVDAATIKVNLPTDGDLSTAVAISNASTPWTQGAKGFSVINSTGLAVKTTGARAVEITTGGGNDITAGKAVFFLAYAVSQ